MPFGTLEGPWLLLTWAGGKGEKAARGESRAGGWSKISKSSSESTISNASDASSSGAGLEEVSSSLRARWLGSCTGWMPARGGPLRNPRTVMLIWWSWGSFALMSYAGAWMLMDIGWYPRMTWVVHNCSSVWRKISDLRILVRSGLLTKLKLGDVNFLSAKIPKIEMLKKKKEEKTVNKS